jgi:hypothetical protein
MNDREKFRHRRNGRVHPEGIAAPAGIASPRIDNRTSRQEYPKLSVWRFGLQEKGHISQDEYARSHCLKAVNKDNSS